MLQGLELPYSWKFRGLKIFTDFTDRSQSAKILTAKILIRDPRRLRLGSRALARSGQGLGVDTYRENINGENLNMANPRKF